MNSHPNPNLTSDNEDNEDDDNNSNNNNDKGDNHNHDTYDFDIGENDSRITVFLCPFCPAAFFSSHRRNIHSIYEFFRMYNQEMVRRRTLQGGAAAGAPAPAPIPVPAGGGTGGVNELRPIRCHSCSFRAKYRSCSVESRRVTRMPAKDNFHRRCDSDRLFKMICPPDRGITELDGYFPPDFDPLPIVLNDGEITLDEPPPQPLSPPRLNLSPELPRETFDHVAPIPDQGADAQSEIDVDAGQEGEAPPPGSPVSDAESGITTLMVGPPNSEEEPTGEEEE